MSPLGFGKGLSHGPRRLFLPWMLYVLDILKLTQVKQRKQLENKSTLSLYQLVIPNFINNNFSLHHNFIIIITTSLLVNKNYSSWTSTSPWPSIWEQLVHVTPEELHQPCHSVNFRDMERGWPQKEAYTVVLAWGCAVWLWLGVSYRPMDLWKGMNHYTSIYQAPPTSWEAAAGQSWRNTGL